MDELIRKQDAIKEICEDIEWLESQGCTEIPLAERKERDVGIIKNLPPANNRLIQIIEKGVKATGTADEYSVGMCNGMKWCKSLLDGKEPEYDIVQLEHDAEPGKMVDDTISRKAAIDAVNEQIEQCNKALGSFDISLKDEFAIKVEKASLEAYKEQLENLPPVQPKQTNCEYCHTDRDGYVFPLEKNSHAFINRDKIVLKANGWRGEAKIKYCPMCGRRLTDGAD